MQCNIQLPNIYKRLSIVAEPTDLVRARQKAVESRLHHLILILLPQPPPHQEWPTAYTMAQPALHRLVGIRRTDPGRRRGTVAGTV